MAEKTNQRNSSSPIPNPILVDEGELLKKVKSIPKPRKDKLYEEVEMKARLRYMDMANALYHECEKYDTYEERFNKLLEKYDELYYKSPGLFQAAINRTLYEGQVGEAVKAFQQGQGNASKVYENLDGIQNDKIDNIIQKINEYNKNSEYAQTEQSKINSIIEKHQKMR